MSWPIEVYSDLSENLSYNFPDLLIYARINELHSYHYAAPCHWHADLEFIKIISGTMDYFINGQFVTLQAGGGIFVNSQLWLF